MKPHNIVALIGFVVVLGSLVVLSACSCSSLPDPKYVVETTAGSDTWTEVGDLPDWVHDPPPRDGYLRFVVDGKSNLRRIVTQIGGPLPRPEVEDFVKSRLAPVVGDEAAAVAATAAYESRVLVERASKDEVLTRDMVPGNTLSTVYALWEVAIDDVVAAVPAEQADAARAALTD